MLRRASALVVSSALAIGGLSAASAQLSFAAEKPPVPARTTTLTASEPPLLAPGRAASIREAQSTFRNRIWNYVPFGVITGLGALIVLSTGDDDNGSVTATTTGTN